LDGTKLDKTFKEIHSKVIDIREEEVIKFLTENNRMDLKSHPIIKNYIESSSVDIWNKQLPINTIFNRIIFSENKDILEKVLTSNGATLKKHMNPPAVITEYCEKPDSFKDINDVVDAVRSVIDTFTKRKVEAKQIVKDLSDLQIINYSMKEDIYRYANSQETCESFESYIKERSKGKRSTRKKRAIQTIYSFMEAELEQKEKRRKLKTKKVATSSAITTPTLPITTTAPIITATPLPTPPKS